MPTSPRASTRPPLRRRLRNAAVALLSTAALGASLLSPAAANAQTPPDEIDKSDNIDLVANLPKPEGFEVSNSDLAFTGDHVIVGNYNGFVIHDVSDPTAPEISSAVLCEGGQGDVSVSGDLLYYSVEYPQVNEECGSGESTAADPNAFEGIRIFDISDKTSPEYIAAVRTDCGSHTNTLLQGEDSDYIYVSSYAPAENFPNCQPPHDKISIIEVPKDDPTSAAVVSQPVLFPDGGNHDQPGLARPTEGCHDITVFPARDIAAGACMGEGVLMDISDPLNPVVTETVRDENFAFWHSATFTNDAKAVIFTDELGGGGAATCNEEVGPERGADAIYTLEGRSNPELTFASYFKIDRHQSDTENCVAHNGSLIPVPGKDYFVQSWYQGGVSIIDFNDPTNPREIGYFDRGPVSETELVRGGTWSAYYYNGYVYSSERTRGFDVLRLDDRRLRGAERITFDEFNPQNQPQYRGR
ncbi:LVIVD repeat-containing protein [Nocardiopsis sediminis]|uniref:LVIVD repeat-containing protein n=1 Tax=Nocardiopsis sediminis TaxID=1778267 RepID=A0ABV8FSR1_9ACTN